MKQLAYAVIRQANKHSVVKVLDGYMLTSADYIIELHRALDTARSRASFLNRPVTKIDTLAVTWNM